MTSFLIQDMRPFNLIEGQGFIDFVKVLEPKIVIPSKKTLKNKYLEPIYHQQREKVF